MKLNKYFRQLKYLIVLPKQFISKGITNCYYYSYYRKIFLKFLLCGLFKNEIQIKFGSDYWKHVPKYLFSDIPSYFYDFVYYKLVAKMAGFEIVSEELGALKSVYTISLQ